MFGVNIVTTQTFRLKLTCEEKKNLKPAKNSKIQNLALAVIELCQFHSKAHQKYPHLASFVQMAR